MHKRALKFSSRFLALFLSLSLGFPSAAFSMRTESADSQQVRSGLEEALRADSPDAALLRITAGVAHLAGRIGFAPNAAPAVAPAPLPAAGLEEEWGNLGLSLYTDPDHKDHRAVIYQFNKAGDQVWITALEDGRFIFRVTGSSGRAVPSGVIIYRGKILEGELGLARNLDLKNAQDRTLLEGEAIKKLLERKRGRLTAGNPKDQEGALTLGLRAQRYAVFFDTSSDSPAEWRPIAQLTLLSVTGPKVKVSFSGPRNVQFSRESVYLSSHQKNHPAEGRPANPEKWVNSTRAAEQINGILREQHSKQRQFVTVQFVFQGEREPFYRVSHRTGQPDAVGAAFQDGVRAALESKGLNLKTAQFKLEPQYTQDGTFLASVKVTARPVPSVTQPAAGLEEMSEGTRNRLIELGVKDPNNLQGVDLSGMNLAGINLTGANLASADLSGADLRGANLTGASLTAASLAGADLAGADLAGADLSGADLRGANLTGANLANAYLRHTDLSGADLSDAYMLDASLYNVNLTRAKLISANLNAKLIRSTLSGADLRGANLAYAILRDTDLSGADLRGANLAHARLSYYAKWSKHKQWNKSTQWPTDFDPHQRITAGLEEEWKNLTVSLYAFKNHRDHRAVIYGFNKAGDQVWITALEEGKFAFRVIRSPSGEAVPSDVVIYRDNILESKLGLERKLDLKNAGDRARLKDSVIKKLLEKRRREILASGNSKAQEGTLALGLKEKGYAVFFDTSSDHPAEWHPIAQMTLVQVVGSKVIVSFSGLKDVQFDRGSVYSKRQQMEGKPAGLEEMSKATFSRLIGLGVKDPNDLQGADLSGMNLAGINLSGLNLRNAKLIRTNLTDANLLLTDLSGADLTRADLTRANLVFARLVHADLTNADLARARLTGAYLIDAYLARARLTGAYLINADLTRANLTGTNLAGANLIRADLRHADLAYAHLTDARLAGVKWDETTRWPAGFDPKRMLSAGLEEGNWTASQLRQIEDRITKRGVVNMDPAELRRVSGGLREAAVSPHVDVAMDAQRIRSGIQTRLSRSALGQVEGIRGDWTPPESPAPLVFLFQDANAAWAPFAAQAGAPVGVIVQTALQAKGMQDLFEELGIPRERYQIVSMDVAIDQASAEQAIRQHFQRIGLPAARLVPLPKGAPAAEIQRILGEYGLRFNTNPEPHLMIVEKYLDALA